MLRPRLKDLGRWSSGGTPPKDREELWEGDLPWVSAKDFNHDSLLEPTTFIADEAQQYSRVAPPDSIILIVRGMALAHGLPVVHTRSRVAFNQDLRALTPASGYLPRFVYYAFRGTRHRLNAHIDHAAHGTARLIDSVMSERLAVPARHEQQRIADFLDRESERIADYKTELEELNENLEEHARGAFMSALTSPAETQPLKRFVRSIGDGPFGSALASKHYIGEPGVRVIRLGNVGVAEFREADRAFVRSDYADSGLRQHFVDASDVIIAGLGDAGHPLARACVVPAEVLPAIHKADCYRVIVDRAKADPHFLALALSFGPAQQAAPLLSRGSTRLRLNTVVARDLPVPELALTAQRQLSSEVEAVRARIQRLSAELSLMEAQLIDYRDALITEAVTGKLDLARLSDQQLDESAQAAMEGQQPEVLA